MLDLVKINFGTVFVYFQILYARSELKQFYSNLISVLQMQ